MTPTILVLLGGLSLILVGIGLLGALLGVRATLASFADLEIGLIMAGYYAGYIAGTVLAPRLIRNVGHIRCFAAFAALASAATLGFGLLVNPYAWLGLRVLNGICVVGLYMVVESWINEQTAGPGRGRVFALHMMSTLVALALGQTLLLAGDSSSLTLFAFAAVLISLGVIPVAVTRVTEPRIDVSMRVRLPQLLRASPLGVMGALSAGTVNGAFWGMAPVFGQRLPLEEPQIVQLMSATIIGGALLQWPIGHLSDRLDRRIVLILTSLATATVALIAGYVVIEGQSGLIPYAFLYGGLMFSLYGISVAHTNDQLEQGQALEATRGLLLIYGIGALCGPVVAGLAMEGAGPVGLPAMSAATAGLLALFGLYRMARRPAPPVADQTGFVPLVRTSPVVLEMLPAADQSAEIDANTPTPGS